MQNNIENLLKNINDSYDLLNLLKQKDVKNYLSNLRSDELTGLICSCINNDIKILLLTEFKNNISFNDSITILENISNDNYKIALIENYTDVKKKLNIILTLENDIHKKEQLNKIEQEKIQFYENLISTIIISCKDDITKYELMNQYHSTSNTTYNNIEIIKSLKSDDKKIKYIEDYYINNKVITTTDAKDIIASIKSEDKKNELKSNPEFPKDILIDILTDEEKYNLALNNNLSLDMFVEILLGISSIAIRQKLFNNPDFKNKLINSEMVNIAEGYPLTIDETYNLYKALLLTDEEKKDFLNSHTLNKELLLTIIEEFDSDKLKVEYIQKNKEIFDTRDNIRMINSIKSEDIRFKLIKSDFAFLLNDDKIFRIKIPYSEKFNLLINKIEKENNFNFTIFSHEEKLFEDLLDKYIDILNSNNQELIRKYNIVMKYINSGDFNTDINIKSEKTLLLLLKINLTNIKISLNNDFISDKIKIYLLENYWKNINCPDLLIESIESNTGKEKIIKEHLDYNFYSKLAPTLKSTFIKVLINDNDKNKIKNILTCIENDILLDKIKHDTILEIVHSTVDKAKTPQEKIELIVMFEEFISYNDLSYIIINSPLDCVVPLLKQFEKKFEMSYILDSMDESKLKTIINNIIEIDEEYIFKIYNNLTFDSKIKFLNLLNLKYIEKQNETSFSELLLEAINNKNISSVVTILKLIKNHFNQQNINIILNQLNTETLYNLILTSIKQKNTEDINEFLLFTEDILDNNKIHILLKNIETIDQNMIKKYIEYIEKKNINLLSIDDINNISNIIRRTSNSNSLEIQNFQMELLDLLTNLNANDINKYINQIENIFLTDNLPTGIKLFTVFKILHPNEEYLNSDKVYSPILKSKKLKLSAKHTILMKDMLKISLNSNPYDMYRYLIKFKDEIIELRKLLEFKNKNPNYKFEDLVKNNNSVYKIINIFKAWKFISESKYDESLEKIYSELNDNWINKMEEWIIHMFSISSDNKFNSIQDIITYIRNNINEINIRNKEISKKQDFRLNPRDLIKGVSKYERYLLNILENGVNCKEFLGANASRDATNLDTDFSMIKIDSENISDAMKDTTAAGFSNNLWFVLKIRPGRFNITSMAINDKVEINNYLDLWNTRMELFKINSPSDDNYGIRSGVPSTEIDFMICNEYDNWIGYSIAMNGFYIPVVDKNGTVVFTPDDYEKIRTKMQGLSHYFCSKIEISEKVKMEGIDTVVDIYRLDKPITKEKLKTVREIISEELKKIGYVTRFDLGSDLLSKELELIGTGSTERGNNKPGDCDFDYMLRIDTEKFIDEEKRNEIVSTLNNLCLSLGGTPKAGNNNKRLRYENVYIESIGEKIEIDISFIKKTNKLDYTSDSALKDKMNNIDKFCEADADYVRANIILAKAILKKGEIYKKEEHGGIGGIGVENWILQNNGSLIEAIDSFLDTFEKYPNIIEFEKHYPIYDFGNNFYDKDFHSGHDNFITFLKDDEHLEKMKTVLKQFKLDYENAIHNGNENEFIADIMGIKIEDLNLNTKSGFSI